MRDRGILGSGGLFVSRPRSVTLGLGIAGAMAGIGILIGLAMLLGYSSIYTGLTTFYQMPESSGTKSEGAIVLIENLMLITAVVRALKPARIPRFVTIGVSGVTGMLWFFSQITNQELVHDLTFWINLFVITNLMIAPAFLLMSESANEFYGD